MGLAGLLEPRRATMETPEFLEASFKVEGSKDLDKLRVCPKGLPGWA